MSAPVPTASWPLVTVVVETSNWERQHRIHLEDTLTALMSQTYPQDCLETLVVLDAPNRFEHARISEAFPWAKVIDAPDGLTYYEFKNLGARMARGDIVALTDADCLPSPRWVEEIVTSFQAAPRHVAVVQGRTRFLRRPLSRAWDASWWSRAFEDEGPIDRLYTSNNMAMRREIVARFGFIEGTKFKAGLERPLTRELKLAGYSVWLNPRAEVSHNYSPRPREIAQQGLVRGYNWMAVRRSYPAPEDRLLMRLGPLTPLVGAAGMYVNDVRRITSHAGAIGLSGWAVLKVPLYLAALVPFDLAALVGMYWALIRPQHAPRRPL